MNIVDLKLTEPIPTASVQEDRVEFEDFWAMYPRREAKKDALKAWAKTTPSQRIEIVTALYWQRKLWADRETRFIMLPASYLNGERWTDEQPAEFVASHQSQQAAVLPEQGKRTAMPEKVKELLAKLRRPKKSPPDISGPNSYTG